MNSIKSTAGYNVEAQYDALLEAAKYAQSLGFEGITLDRPNYDPDIPANTRYGGLQVYSYNSPTDSEGEPIQGPRLAALVVRPDQGGDHTLVKLGIDDLDRTAIMGLNGDRVHFFRVDSEAPAIRPRQLGPGVELKAGGWMPLPPTGGREWLPGPGLENIPDGLATVDPVPMNEDPASRGRFKRVDAAEIARQGTKEAADLAYRLIAAGKVNGFMGAVQAGKTYTALQVCLFIIQQGLTVMWMAHEDEAEDLVDSLLDMGASESDLGRFLIYPSPDATPADARHFQGLVRAVDPALVVWDNLATVLSAAGVDENSNTQVSNWYRLFAKSIRKYGVASLILDHTREGQTKEARGARSKRAETDVMWTIKALRPFDETKTGAIKLTCQKDKAWRKFQGTTRTFSAGGPNAIFDDGQTALTNNQKTMLDALPQAGATWADWRKAATDAGIKSGSLNKARATLLDGGHVEEIDGFYSHR